MLQRLGHYPILGELARGGMGVIYRGQDPATGGAVAIKVLLGVGPVARRRFEREVEALKRVSHPRVVRLLDHGQAPSGEPFLVMEAIAGGSMEARLLHDGPLEVEDAVRVLLELCDALSACHAAGVLHRDLKPANLLLDAGGVKLTDFGLARDTDPSCSRTQLSRDGSYLGSPGYWAPEQATGELERIGERTDVYGLGATLFALLTARAPYEPTTLVDALRGAREPKPAPSSLNPSVPRWVDAIVGRALEIEPADRFPSAAALAEALRRGEPSPFAGRGRWNLVAALSLVILGLLGALVSVTRARSTSTSSRSVDPRAPTTLLASPREPVVTTTLTRSESATLALAAAYRLLDAGDYPGAIERFGEALCLHPQDAEALADRAIARKRLGDLSGAIVDATAAISVAPRISRAYMVRALARGTQGDRDGAHQDLTAAIAIDPNDAEAYHARALLQLDRGERRGGLADAAQALALAPRADWAIRLRERADTSLPAGAEDRPPGTLTPRELALLRTNAGDHAGALASFTEAIAVDPGDPALWRLRGNARRALGDLRGAADDYTRAIELDPSYTRAYLSRGFTRESLGDYRGAIEDASAAIRLAPGFGRGYFNRGVARYAAGDMAGAMADYTRRLELNPEDALAWFNLGATRYHLEDWEGALAAYSETVRLEPGNADALYMRAVTRERLHDWVGVVADLDEALRLDPTMGEAFYPRCQARLRLGEWRGAIADATRAIEHQPDHAKAYLRRAEAREQLGELEEAVADFSHALTLEPDAPWRGDVEETLRVVQARVTEPGR